MAHPKQSPCPIDFVIVGGSLTGLSCALALSRVGHNVTVLERGVKDADLGGGCHLTPNASKVLYEWGLREELERRGQIEKLHSTLFYSIDPEEFLGEQHFPPHILDEMGGDWIFISYMVLREILAETCTKAGVTILYEVNVTEIDPEARTVTTIDGATYTGDVVLAADGAHGLGRKLLGGTPGVPVGHAFYSAALEAEDAVHIPELKSGPEADVGNASFVRWGDGWCLHHYVKNARGDRAVQLYIAGDVEGPGNTWLDGRCVSFTTLLKDKNIPEWIRRLFQHTGPASRCQNYEFEEIEDWVPDDDVPFLVVGCASHAFPQGSIQSFGMVFEDAGVLGGLFSHLQTKEQIPSLLYGFQDIRQERCQSVIRREHTRTKMFVLEKGEMQQERDDAIRKLGKVPGADAGIYSLEEPEKVFAYDCNDEVEDWWHAWGALHSVTHEIEEPVTGTLEIALDVEIKALTLQQESD